MLNELLERVQHYDIDTKVKGITNHLPMALIALDRLGASPERLEEYFEFYSEKLKPLESLSYDEDFNWLEHLGEKEKFNVYLDFYSKQISLYGITSTLRTYIDKLIQGCAASAFHALIRLSYGIIQENPKEITFGLAHMSSHFILLPLPLKGDTKSQELVNNALNVFSNYTAVGNSVTQRMTDISNHPDFSRINSYPSDLSLGSFSTLFSQLYLQSNDFTMLHAVTSSHAMRVVLPYISDESTALKSYWSAALVAVLSIKNLNFNEIVEGNSITTDKLNFKNAINSNDDHMIKLVFSCVEEYRYYNKVNHLKILNGKLKNVT
ncbi:questin oxidase family protein [Photobacterium sp.]|uniref:questin oxidase family protein n=1 Tax=Photobacterium sp. TaxID=660 RepID=UPI00299E5B56|nr:questin oxidase family protein [Photobacterium sp.]MDX1303233.1 questin oxidase family protein [Photobacterium sp.]